MTPSKLYQKVLSAAKSQAKAEVKAGTVGGRFSDLVNFLVENKALVIQILSLFLKLDK